MCRYNWLGFCIHVALLKVIVSLKNSSIKPLKLYGFILLLRFYVFLELETLDPVNENSWNIVQNVFYDGDCFLGWTIPLIHLNSGRFTE